MVNPHKLMQSPHFQCLKALQIHRFWLPPLSFSRCFTSNPDTGRAQRSRGAQGATTQHLPLHLPGAGAQLLRRRRVDVAAREELLHVVHGGRHRCGRRGGESRCPPGKNMVRLKYVEVFG